MEIIKWLELFALLSVFGILHNTYQIMTILHGIREKIKD